MGVLSYAKIIGGIAVLALIAGGYFFINHLIDARVNAAIEVTQDAIAARVNAATAATITKQAQDNAAREDAFLARLSALTKEQSDNAVQFNQAVAQFEKHDIAKDAAAKPGLVGPVLSRGTDRVNCLLEQATGSNHSCDAVARGAAPAGATVPPARKPAPGDVAHPQ